MAESSATSGGATGLDDALAPMREQLAADGYGLRATPRQDGVLTVEVIALEDACEECLVPKDLLAAMVSDQLTAAGVTVSDLEVAYPGDA